MREESKRVFGRAITVLTQALETRDLEGMEVDVLALQDMGLIAGGGGHYLALMAALQEAVLIIDDLTGNTFEQTSRILGECAHRRLVAPAP